MGNELDNLVEDLADVSHQIWSHWMSYMMTQGTYTDMGWIMPLEKVERWTRQMETDYADLTEREKDSDRSQAHKIMKVLYPIEEPVLMENGKYENVMVKIQGKSFRCHCSGNVFHKPDKTDLNLFECNSCGERYNSE